MPALHANHQLLHAHVKKLANVQKTTANALQKNPPQTVHVQTHVSVHQGNVNALPVQKKNHHNVYVQHHQHASVKVDVNVQIAKRMPVVVPKTKSGSE